MRARMTKFRTLTLLGGALLACGFVGQPAQAATSSEVAYMGSLAIQNGGTLPGTSPYVDAAFSGFSFHQATRTTLSLANLLGSGGSPICGAGIKCDTFVLNVASAGTTGVACNLANLTAQQKSDINAFVQQGGKLIIYDSECVPQDYSWLPYPFTTNNPGATGSLTGTLTIVEDNALSSANSADTHYINAALMTAGTDAVGDMNVMVTRNANWCLDMSGTNVRQVTGPVHTYARYGQGLMIYNGMDVDYINIGGSTPGTATGPANLRKTWLQELQVAFNPTPLADLPCGVTVVGLTLTPATATNTLPQQSSHTVTAALKDLLGNPEPGHLLTFTVLSGPNTGATGTCAPASCTTPANGQVTFTYSSNMSTGTDTIQVCTLDNAGQPICSQTVTKSWVFSAALACDVDQDGDIDRNDLALISRARGQTAQPGDVRDADGDGLITPNDVKVCILKCTRPSCAIQ